MLMHCLLLVCLLANGAGLAQASTRMQLAHATHVSGAIAAAEHTRVAAAADCHAQAAMPSVVQSDAPHPGAVEGGEKHVDSQESAGCCEGATCHCPCAQQASMAFGFALQFGVLLTRSPAPIEGAPQHVSPQLPHLIRPPIS